MFIHRRDRAILGMVVFQALRRKELQLLEVDHLDINEGTLYVPAMSRSNARTLPLHPAQMGHLMEYLYEFRPKLLTEAGKQTDRLFFSMGGGSTLNNVLQIGMRALRRDCPAFRSLEQVRESRMAQYLSGIKYASSMLRYVVTDIEELQKKLDIVHPMERL